MADYFTRVPGPLEVMRWDDEIVLGGTESPDHIIDNIKKLYLETK